MIYTVERRHCCVGGGREAMFRLTYEASYIDDLQLWRCFLVHAEEIGKLLPEQNVLKVPVLVPELGKGAAAAISARVA